MHVRNDLKRKLEGLIKRDHGGKEGVRIMIGKKDFNTRTGEVEGRIIIKDEGNNQENRKLNDRKINKKSSRKARGIEDSTFWIKT